MLAQLKSSGDFVSGTYFLATYIDEIQVLTEGSTVSARKEYHIYAQKYLPILCGVSNKPPGPFAYIP